MYIHNGEINERSFNNPNPWLSRNRIYIGFRKNYVALDIYYTDLSVLRIMQQEADSLNSFICK